jgi:hypothetical protein
MRRVISDLQRLDLGAVAAPDRGEVLELGDDLGALEVAELIAQGGLAQAPLRGGGPVLRVGGGAIVSERVLVAAERLGELAAQYRDGGRKVGRHADLIELVELPRGGGEIARLDRGAHRVLDDEALQLHRQRADRRVEPAERLARLRPFALLRVGDRAPELGFVLVADQRVAEILQGVIAARHHQIGDRAHHDAGGVLGARPLVAERHVEHALGFGVHVAREIEPGKLEPCARALALGRGGRRVEEPGLTIAELGFLVEAPKLRVEHERTIAAGALGDGAAGRQRQPARPSDLDLIVREPDRDVVRERLDREPMDRGERTELDEVLSF